MATRAASSNLSLPTYQNRQTQTELASRTVKRDAEAAELDHPSYKRQAPEEGLTSIFRHFQQQLEEFVLLTQADHPPSEVLKERTKPLIPDMELQLVQALQGDVSLAQKWIDSSHGDAFTLLKKSHDQLQHMMQTYSAYRSDFNLDFSATEICFSEARAEHAQASECFKTVQKERELSMELLQEAQQSCQSAIENLTAAYKHAEDTEATFNESARKISKELGENTLTSDSVTAFCTALETFKKAKPFNAVVKLIPAATSALKSYEEKLKATRSAALAASVARRTLENKTKSLEDASHNHHLATLQMLQLLHEKKEIHDASKAVEKAKDDVKAAEKLLSKASTEEERSIAQTELTKTQEVLRIAEERLKAII